MFTPLPSCSGPTSRKKHGIGSMCLCTRFKHVLHVLHPPCSSLAPSSSFIHHFLMHLLLVLTKVLTNGQDFLLVSHLDPYPVRFTWTERHPSIHPPLWSTGPKWFLHSRGSFTDPTGPPLLHSDPGLPAVRR